MPAYAPIRDYAAIGDCHGAALVSRDGSVDWCCLGRFDAAPVFCRILDARRGGFLEIRPETDYTVAREYLPGTNVLRTTFTTSTGAVRVTDFMPVGRTPGAGVHDYVTLEAPAWLVRLVEGVAGHVPVSIRYRPSVDFARRPARLTPTDGGIVAADGPWLATDIALSVDGEQAGATVDVRAGDEHHLVVAMAPVAASGLAPVRQMLDVTRAFWEEWSGYCRYDGPYRDAVVRSALALKMLTHEPSGAMVAAPTTSLPEEIGGERNWDYRYAWLRDSVFILDALASVGYSGEARRFAEFLVGRCLGKPLQIMYGIDGRTDLTEHELPHLEGYCGSRPVRIGNGAFLQQQLDVHGEVLDWAHLYWTLGGRFDGHSREFLAALPDFVVQHWQEPDQGIWEMRGPPRHHVFGKIMSWVALDRAIRLFGARRAWVAARAEIEATVKQEGVVDGVLVQAFGSTHVDAALLLTAEVGFPIELETFARTVDAIQRVLRRGDYVLRYVSDDGVPGGEGAFLICSFWLVDALIILDRAAEARTLYERLLGCANDVGLYSEEIDPESRAFLGNFPQAFTHLALIESAARMAMHERHGPTAVAGSHSDRARYGVEATAGPWALWAAFKKTGRVGRLRTSRASILQPFWRP